MNPQQLGDAVKAKFPGAYDSLDSATLGQKVLTKYPQYGQANPAPQPTSQPFDKQAYLAQHSQTTFSPQGQPTLMDRLQGAAKKVTDLTGTTNLGRGLGAAGQVVASKVSGKPLQTNYSPPTNKQIAGSTGNLLGTLALGVGAPESFGGRVAQNAAIGGLMGASTAANNNQSGGKIATSALLGGGAGAALPAALEGLASGAKGVLNKGADYAYNSAVKTPARQLLSGREDLAQGLKQRGIAGSYNSMIKKVQTLLDTNGATIGDIITQNSDKTVNVNNVIKRLEDAKAVEARVGTPTGPYDAIIQSIKDLAAKTPGNPNELPVSEAQTLKQQFGSKVGDKFYRALNPGIAGAQTEAYRGLNNELTKALPDAYKAANNEYSFAQRVLPQLSKGQASKENITKDILQGGLMHLVPGGTPLTVIEQLLSRPATGTRIAQGATKLAKPSLSPQVLAAVQRLLAHSAGKVAGQ